MQRSERTVDFGGRREQQSKVRKKSIFNDLRWVARAQFDEPQKIETLYEKNPNRTQYQRHQSLDLKKRLSPNATFEIEPQSNQAMPFGHEKAVFLKNHFKKKSRDNLRIEKIGKSGLQVDLARALMCGRLRKSKNFGGIPGISRSRKSCFVKTSSHFFEIVKKDVPPRRLPSRSMAKSDEHCIWEEEAAATDEVQPTQSDLMDKLSEVESQENDEGDVRRLKVDGNG